MGIKPTQVNKEIVLPEGLTLRPATKADFTSLYEMWLEYEQQLYGTQESSFEEALIRWTTPDLDLEQDSLLAFDQAGQLVAWLRLNHDRFAEFRISVQVRP